MFCLSRGAADCAKLPPLFALLRNVRRRLFFDFLVLRGILFALSKEKNDLANFGCYCDCCSHTLQAY
jgi:hypothetical protein